MNEKTYDEKLRESALGTMRALGMKRWPGSA